MSEQSQAKRAGRGTTEAEGLEQRVLRLPRKEFDKLGDGYVRLSDVLEIIRAATQRAPVTPPEGGIPKRLWEPICDANGVPLKCSICGSEIPRIDMGWHGDAEGKVVQHIECSYQQQIKKLQAKLATPAPVTTPGRDEVLAKEAWDAGVREGCEFPWAVAEMGPITVDVLKGLAEESKRLHPYMSLIYHSWIAQRLNHLVFHAVREALAAAKEPRG